MTKKDELLKERKELSKERRERQKQRQRQQRPIEEASNIHLFYVRRKEDTEWKLFCCGRSNRPSIIVKEAAAKRMGRKRRDIAYINGIDLFIKVIQIPGSLKDEDFEKLRLKVIATLEPKKR